jgi:hypothetical protein
MGNNTAGQDERLIVQLDRLRDEAEMRKARCWWRDDFWPRSAADYLKIEMAHGAQQNKSLRQVVTYWGMAASFVLDGTLSEKAFLRSKFSGEMFAMFAKIQPFLKQLRAHAKSRVYGECRAAHPELQRSPGTPPRSLKASQHAEEGGLSLSPT